MSTGPRADAGELSIAAKNDREDHVAAGEVSVEEARAILLRFCASHFDAHRQSDREKARMSIPANPLRDDDIRLGAFISRAEKAFAEVARLRATIEQLRSEGESVPTARAAVIATASFAQLVEEANAIIDMGSTVPSCSAFMREVVGDEARRAEWNCASNNDQLKSVVRRLARDELETLVRLLREGTCGGCSRATARLDQCALPDGHAGRCRRVGETDVM